MMENNNSNELPIESFAFKDFNLNDLETRFNEVGTERNEEPHDLKAIRPLTQGEAASKRKFERDVNLKLESMQKYVESVEQKNIEHVKFRKKVIRELEQRTREVKFYEKQCADQQAEINSLRNQLESSLRITQSGNRAFAKGKLGSVMSPNLASNVKIPQLLMEMKNLQSTLDNNVLELRNNKDLLDKANMKIKVLQDALSLRSEEIGLSGHADLLAKVAQMKEEVSLLKNELHDKVLKLEIAEESNHSLSNNQMSLEAQIHQIQMKLAETQKEVHQSSEVDLIQHLRLTKQERDSLVEYIQKDMRKSTVFAKQVEELEHSMRSLQARIADQELQIADLRKVNSNLQADNDHHVHSEIISTEEYQELQRGYNELIVQLQSKDMQVEMKVRQLEESERMRKLTSEKLTAYETEMLQSNEQIFRLKTVVSDLENMLSSYQHDNEKLKCELSITKEETLRLKDRIESCEPKLQLIEPQLRSFLVENNDLRAKVVALELKLSEHRTNNQLITDLNKDFQVDSATTNDSVSDYYPYSDSQRHAIWIGYPSIRNLGCGLYEKIRQLAQDLHRNEFRVIELTEENNRLARDLSIKTKDWDDAREHLEKRHLLDTEKLSTVLTETALQEKELCRLRSVESIYLQIRTLLAPLFDIEPLLSEPSENTGLLDTKHVSREFLQFSDSMLPALVRTVLDDRIRLLAFTKDHDQKLESLQRRNLEMNESLNISRATIENLESKLLELQKMEEMKEKRIQDLSQEFSVGMNEATELVERQNDLIVSLQAKIEDFQKEKLLKSTQIQALVHRENVLRNQVLLKCERCCIPVPYNFCKPSASANVNDLVNFIVDYLLQALGK